MATKDALTAREGRDQTMTVAQLTALLALLPQNLPVFVYDADECRLLRLTPDNVARVEPDKTYGYPFDRVEIGGDYYSSPRVTREAIK